MKLYALNRRSTTILAIAIGAASLACSTPEPENPAEDLQRQAEALRLDGEFQEALGLYEQAVELDPEYAPAYLGMAQASSALGDYAGGEKNYLLATTLDPTDFAAQLNFAGFYYRNRNYERALQVLQKAMDLAPDDDQEAMVSGLWTRVESAQVRATVRQSLLATLQENPEDQSIAADLAESYSGEATDLLQGGNSREAMAVIEEGMTVVPDPAQAGLYYVGAQIHGGLENDERAFEWLEKAIELDDTVAVYHLSLAGFLMEREEWNEALAALDRVSELAPGSEEAEFARLRREDIQRRQDISDEQLEEYLETRRSPDPKKKKDSGGR